MTLLIGKTSIVLWQDVVKYAENRCDIQLNETLESYLVSLLMRYTNQPEVAKQLFATAFLEAMQSHERERHLSLQHVGDQCLLFTGLFPHFAEKRHVKLNYFVDLGRSAYATISDKSNDLYWTLACEFVALMDVLQSIRENADLLPLEAYEQWNDLGSKRALTILKSYSQAIPLKNTRRYPF